MPSPILLRRNGFCNFFAWFSMETFFFFWVRLQLENLVEVASARFCPIYSMWDTTVLGSFWIPLQRDGTCDLAVPTRPSLCTYARSSQFWVAIHDRLGLWENDREYFCDVLLESQLFCGISSTRWRLYGTLSVLQFCRVEHHGDAPSWSRSAGWSIQS